MFYPEKKRTELAMKLNNLLASPGFGVWLEGAALDIQHLLYTPEGKPRISIFSIAHLGDTERMFFVSLLFNQMLGWMRSQSGTTSLRAILYMDEIYGYLPPTANPPSKKPLLTMLKQARAFGLGVLLATQNPVDLDYKALSNMGTWFLGRLQTERDKMRVLDGLEGAASSQGGHFDRQKMEQILAGLGSRVFLLNNVNEDAPTIFHVRWVMSYLRGPLSRGQIKTLMDPRRAELLGHATPSAAVPSPSDPPPSAPSQPAPPTTTSAQNGPGGGFGSPVQPALPPSAQHFFAPSLPSQTKGTRVYVPAVLRSANILFSNPKLHLESTSTLTQVTHLDPATGHAEWSRPIPDFPPFLHPASAFLPEPEPGALFAPLPDAATRSTFYTGASSNFVDWLYQNASLALLRSPATGIVSRPGEREGDFRARLTHHIHEVRDRRIDEIRSQYGRKIADLEDEKRRAENYLEEQAAQAANAKWDTAARVGTSILGAILGRKIGRARSTKTSTAIKEHNDVKRAQARLQRVQIELDEIFVTLQNQIIAIKENLDPLTERLESLTVKPFKKNIATTAVGILWLPHIGVPDHGLVQNWHA